MIDNKTIETKQLKRSYDLVRFATFFSAGRDERRNEVHRPSGV